MADTSNPSSPSLLDPQNTSEWASVRSLGHRMIDDVVDHLRTIGDRAVWAERPPDRRDLDLPRNGQGVGPAEAYERFLGSVLPYGPGGPHPRFWGWVTGTGTMTGIYAEMLAATVNGPAGLFNDVTGDVEESVLAWCRELMGYPADAGGIITSGASVANLIGLLAGRDALLDGAVASRGLRETAAPLFVYGSDQVHSSVPKAMSVMGLGREHFRSIESDAHFRLSPSLLKKAISADRARDSMAKAIVVVSAGTVNTGAVDPIAEIAEVCDETGAWLHVDGAIGALACLAPSVRPMLAPIALADSIAFDFHKWLYIPYEAGCVLIRDRTHHSVPFTVPAAYLSAIPRGLAGPSFRAGDLGLQLSRGFKALKVWMSILSEGPARYAAAIEKNLELARQLVALVRESSCLETVGEGDLNIVCFRFVPPVPRDAEETNEINREILMRLHERGIAAPSHTSMRGSFALRCSITNHRTTLADLRALVENAAAIGHEIVAERKGDAA